MVEIGPVVSEEKIFEKVYRQTTDDGRRTPTTDDGRRTPIAHTGELKGYLKGSFSREQYSLLLLINVTSKHICQFYVI